MPVVFLPSTAVSSEAVSPLWAVPPEKCLSMERRLTAPWLTVCEVVQELFGVRVGRMDVWRVLCLGFSCTIEPVTEVLWGKAVFNISPSHGAPCSKAQGNSSDQTPALLVHRDGYGDRPAQDIYVRNNPGIPCHSNSFSSCKNQWQLDPFCCCFL